MTNEYKPILAITMGDPSGIGPEIAAKAFANAVVYSLCRPLLIGNKAVMDRALRLVGNGLKINTIAEPAEAGFNKAVIDLIHIESDHIDSVKYGEVSSASGDLAFKAVRKAIELALDKKVDGTVTGPIHKAAINAAGHHFSGHTEIYAHYTNTSKYAMLLAEEDLRVIHVSTHVSLRQACDNVKKARIVEVIHLLNDSLKGLGIENPVIGVAGLNPHAGDGGLFGDEETKEIEPAIREVNEQGIRAEGPVPPDTMFALAKGGKYDGCVAMYHDQGHIPFKLVGFNWDKNSKKMKSVKGVNITLGLPIIRTSVDHGTAFEIAGKGIASPDALILAVEYAVKLYQNLKQKSAKV